MIANRRTILVWFLAAVAVACIAGCLWLLRWGQSHGAARDETDLDTLLAELVRVIEETMQPETVSVWLKESTTPLTYRLRQTDPIDRDEM